MSTLRVHLDHLIKRQSIRYYSLDDSLKSEASTWGNEDRSLRYDDLLRTEGWISQIRKPDFQRETNAWTPKDCVDFLDTVVYGKIIPSIILWANKSNNLVYVLDGSHRLSVLRAWFLDDWGDKAGDYYHRRDVELIKEAAAVTRVLVKERIGHFNDFKNSFTLLKRIIDEGKAPKSEMDNKCFHQANFYSSVKTGLLTLSVQWEKGDYDSAEQSFLRINRSGQPLDPWEATLIEFRNSSYARCVMSIANGGESGAYWPELPKSHSEEEKKELEELNNTVLRFGDKATRIYRRLFVPPFSQPIADLNVPFMVAPEYFQKHKYLLEIIPLVTEKLIAIDEEKQVEIMKKDFDKSPKAIIKNGEKLYTQLEESLDNFISESSSSKSLSLVPLFYWYNESGKFIRGLFYGFIYWMLSGTEEEIKNRKLVFSINRDRFEKIIFDFNPEISPSMHRTIGAGLKATIRLCEFYQELLSLLNKNIGKTTDDLEDEVASLLVKKGLSLKTRSKASKKRLYTVQDKTVINIREMFYHSVKCHICGGIVNLHQDLQYDHTQDFAVYRVTDPDTGKPTHPFCNNFKKQILEARSGKVSQQLPKVNFTNEVEKKSRVTQLSFWGNNDDFPV